MEADVMRRRREVVVVVVVTRWWWRGGVTAVAEMRLRRAHVWLGGVGGSVVEE